MPTTGERFERAVAIMARLRGPDGCPWDREQTFDSIKPYTLEETYEVLEAIDNRDWDELPGELGDLLLQVLFYAQMAKDQGTFSIDEVLDRLSDKLVNRHPHGQVRANVNAKGVIVQGKLDGNIRASERAELTKSAIAVGDITTQRVAIEEGAYFKGKVDIQKDMAKADGARTAAAASSSAAASASGGSTMAVKTNPSEGK